MSRPSVRTGRAAVGAVTTLAVLGAWEAVGRSGSVLFLEPFSVAARGAWDLLTGPGLRQDVLPSAARAATGFFVGSALGIAAGLLLGHFRVLDPWVRPVLEFLRAVPIPAVLPVAVLTFGPTSGTRVGLIALGAVWPVLLNTVDGARAVDAGFVDAARAAQAGRWRVVSRVIWPACLPQVFAGLRIALGISLIMMVISEMVASTSGLGFFVLQAQRAYAFQDMYAGVLVLGLLGGLFTVLFTVVEHHVLAWYEGQKGIGRG
ncbi:ABC transporter permease [Streptomyces sp. NPDC059785]|uniref:ABC transporter permease n=1 Tax=unclassified Streptomyces TaxID=2593676 RepID=UPI00365EB037